MTDCVPGRPSPMDWRGAGSDRHFALVGRSLWEGTWFHAVVFLIYGLSMICLYTASTLYHCVNTTAAKRIALRKYDHCSIYLLIAGSYTPICMTVLRQEGGVPLLSVIWALAAAGILLTIAKLEIPRWLTSVIYLFMGWLALTAILPLSRLLPTAGMAWLVLGGVLYTVGGVLYAVKWPGRNNPRFGCHEIFHVFILLGSPVSLLPDVSGDRPPVSFTQRSPQASLWLAWGFCVQPR